MKCKSAKTNVVFLTWYFPKGSGGFTYRKKLLTLLSSIDSIQTIIVLTSDIELQKFRNAKIKILLLNHFIPENPLFRFFRFLLFQLKVIIYLTRYCGEYSTIFVMSGNNFALPVLFCKIILKKKIVYLMSGVGGISVWELYPSNLLSRIIAILDELTLLLSDFIILESPRLRDVLKLDRYRGKVIQNGRMYVEREKMQYTIPFSRRRNVIGYIGRLSPEKGVLNFARSILRIRMDTSVKVDGVIIGGGGPLETEIKKLLSLEENINIQILGHITENKVPKILNHLKLLILPSLVEGLPNILLESMACGTPVLATPVGAILDVIIDEKTGFIMRDNSPETIVMNIGRALTHPELPKISRKSIKTVQKEFNFESALNRWKHIIEYIVG